MEQRTVTTDGKAVRGLSVRDLCYIAVFTAIIAVLAQISIPLPGGVPLTLQTMAVMLAGVVLGKKNGTISVLVYVLLGAVGVPVFANFTGGIGRILGMTGGFIVSFPLLALAAGIGADLRAKHEVFLWIGLVIGVLVNYAVGVLWFVVVAESTVLTALTACVVPFIPTDIIKLALAGVLGILLKKALLKAGLME